VVFGIWGLGFDPLNTRYHIPNTDEIVADLGVGVKGAGRDEWADSGYPVGDV